MGRDLNECHMRAVKGEQPGVESFESNQSITIFECVLSRVERVEHVLK
jgi:hypothetical protein